MKSAISIAMMLFVMISVIGLSVAKCQGEECASVIQPKDFKDIPAIIVYPNTGKVRDEKGTHTISEWIIPVEGYEFKTVLVYKIHFSYGGGTIAGFQYVIRGKVYLFITKDGECHRIPTETQEV